MGKICAVCRKNDILCSACDNLFRSGKITKTEIEIERALAKMGVDAEFFRVLEYKNRIVVIAGKDAGKIIGKSGKNARELKKVLGKEVDVIETGDEKKIVEKMIRAPVIGINRVYGREEKYRIRISKKFRNKIRADINLIGIVLGKPVEIVFE